MIHIVTGIYGTIDHLKDIWQQTVPCTWNLVTDQAHLNPRGWNMIFEQQVDGRHPRLRAKEPKLRPWRYVGDPGDVWIWVDGSMEIVNHRFAEELADGSEPLSQWAHPDRVCIQPEAALSATLPKYFETPVLDQAAHYANIGHPDNWGLWATGLIVYRQPLPYLADLWWAEMNQWGYQDQISQPVALRAAGIRPVNLPFDLRSNPWIRLHSHLTHL